jgi:tripartite-type tricarboxylate transporter receptor subunit TctC
MRTRTYLLLMAGLSALPASASAQTYPTRPVTLVVPYAAGGPVDIAGRSTAEALSAQIKQQVVVENKPGAGGVVGTRSVATARPDGYTLLLGSPGPLVIAPSANPGSLDVEKEFRQVGVVADSPQVLVVASKIPATNLAELVAYAKTRPGALNYGSAGIGTTPHLAAELLNRATGVHLVHVPYRGTSAAVPDLLSGELQVMFGDIATLRPFIEARSIKALAVTGTVRSKLIPDVPTTVEAGFPTLISRNFYVVLAPASVTDGVVATLDKALTVAKADKAFIARLETQGMNVVESSPIHARDYLRAERQIWEPIIRDMGLKLKD